MSNDDSRIKELTVALQNAEQKLIERKTLITAAIGQTEAARQQYEQANERAETLRRRVDAKDEQLSILRIQLETASADLKALRESITARDQQISSLQLELQRREVRIATLENLNEESDNALNAINQDVKRQDLANPSEQLTAMGLVLESMDGHGFRHQINRVTTTLGRSGGNDIAINSASVSRFHARIILESGGVFLIDLQSTNGCKVNGSRVSRQLINDGDIIAIGSAKFKLAIGVPLAESEDRSMDETHALLEDAEIFSVVPKGKNNLPQKQAKPGQKVNS